jgi:hypothetical protein
MVEDCIELNNIEWADQLFEAKPMSNTNFQTRTMSIN